ncbi:MAG: enoyl-ACP reductase FabI [Holosporaceae bacterium]
MTNDSNAPATNLSALLAGTRGLIMGVANDRSIAWAIAQAAKSYGAELALTYQGEVFAKRVKPLAENLGVAEDCLFDCDVTDEASVEKLFQDLAKRWGNLDFVVHAIAYSDKEELKGRYVDTSRSNFLNTMDISCFSFTSVCRQAAPLMRAGGSLLTLTYYGAERVMPHYNVMGVAKAALEASVRYLAVDLGGDNIRVNALSAGPIKTLAASGIGDFRYILKWNQYNSPLKRNVTLDEVGRAGAYLLSELSSGVTGEVHHVDCGYHVVGMKAIDAPDIALVDGGEAASPQMAKLSSAG